MSWFFIYNIDHYYNSIVNNSKICVSCDVSCKTCTSGQSSDCQTCSDGYFSSNSLCSKCDSNCLTCETTSTFCLTCEYIFENVNIIIFQNKCINEC